MDAGKLDWPKVLQELEEATRELISIREEMQGLRREETNAINRVNAAQKALDQHLETTRSRCAQEGIDWPRAARREARDEQ